MHRATAELKASGIEWQALKIGDRASSFALFNQDHVQVVLNDLLREGYWWSAFSGDTGDLIATWSWRLYTESILKSEYSVFTLPDYLRDLYKRSAMHWTGSTMRRSTDCRYLHGTWSTSKGSSAQPM